MSNSESYCMKWTWVLFVVALPAFAHQGHHHDPHPQEPTNESDHHSEFKIINEVYVNKIKPIFQKKCMDCHSDQTRFPWYHSIPGVRQAMDQDIAEARSHLDFSKDFPFQSHASISEDLEAIRNSISNGSMPPLSYRLFHPAAKLSPMEIQSITSWTDKSLNILGKKEN